MPSKILPYIIVSTEESMWVLFQLVSEDQVSLGVFSFRLAASGSELYVGGVDSSKCQLTRCYMGIFFFDDISLILSRIIVDTGSITYAPLTSATYWLTTGSANVGGTAAYTGAMIIDSGTHIFVSFMI